jgi:hypothetical protein
MEYVLILAIFWSGDVTSQAILFPSQQACEAARVAARDGFKVITRNEGVCVPRGTP